MLKLKEFTLRPRGTVWAEIGLSGFLVQFHLFIRFSGAARMASVLISVIGLAFPRLDKSYASGMNWERG